MNKSLKKIWNVISTILVALVVLLALLLVGARVVGLQVFTVLSGSMEPTYHTGSLIYVKAEGRAECPHRFGQQVCRPHRRGGLDIPCGGV